MSANLLEVDGTSIEVARIAGHDAGNIVLLHEGLGCVALWRDFPARLGTATGQSIIAYSRAGYGNSDGIDLPRPLNHMRREAHLFLPRLLSRLEVDRPILLGHSDGATIALEFAAAFPDALSALILMAPHVFVEEVAIEAITAVNKDYQTTQLREKLRRYHGDNVDSAFRGWCDTWLNPGFRTWDMRSALPKIRVPILQLQGVNDTYGTVAQLQDIESMSGGAVTTVVLDACGHSPFQDKPNETLEEIAKFVQSLILR